MKLYPCVDDIVAMVASGIRHRFAQLNARHTEHDALEFRVVKEVIEEHTITEVAPNEITIGHGVAMTERRVIKASDIDIDVTNAPHHAGAEVLDAPASST